ncbi:alpha/beta hydrolase fold domain-containing protein [Lindgomyces ingoldianus]|uniref:Alpha/beta hydrolase fold domain-containing protein n=1 Tax=Lindgomyces ingoldianus TaxID=673940 RepID=A0ACB6QCV4_9PLEO|nr:alpha/beta hydrolase fold domain-containing protein [Lindgomyces ingoldianus]KAF2464778.1 alpha/beta hydrolase fold domain-containing protein [Lindgomyces ingoldianus]
MQESESLTLGDGRTLSFAVYGAPASDTTVLYFHAFPSSRLEGRLWHAAAKSLNVRFVVPDRPGMGNSTFQPSRTILDWPKDTITLVDHLGIERFYVMGLSGGGPYTLACLYGIPKERLAGASVIGGLYPITLGTAGMMMASRIMLWVAPWMTGLFGTLMDYTMGKAARNKDPKVFEDLVMKEMRSRPEVDQQSIKDENIKHDFIESTREGVRQGSQGAAWEARLFGSPWGFELTQLHSEVPLTLWHGNLDINSPSAMVTKAKEMLPGATLRLEEGEGHVSLAFKFREDILRELLGR